VLSQAFAEHPRIRLAIPIFAKDEHSPVATIQGMVDLAGDLES
jgi:hypothetical protein